MSRKQFNILYVVIILGIILIFSCAKNEDGQFTGSTENTAVTQELNGKILPDLPEKDFEGYTFTFLSHRHEHVDWMTPDPREIVAEAENAELINDAVYRRNLMIEENYNVKINMFTAVDEVAALEKAVKSDSDDYDAVIVINFNVPKAVHQGNLLKITNLPYVDLSKPWWDSAVNALSIDEKNYLLAGDLLILDNEATTAFIFNKNLLEDYALETPYILVNNNKWTMDKLGELTKGASKDLNGDGVMDYKDQWGLYTYGGTLHALLVSGGGSLALKDENDIPYMTLTNEKNLRIIDKAMDVMYDKQNVLNVQNISTSTPGQTGYDSFSEGRVLFYWVRMRVVEVMRNMENDFGIIPMPKYDENQDKYYSVVNANSGVLLGVPKSVRNIERTSIILEAMSAESRYTLQPAYYDVTLTRKFTRDSDSEEMLDIIFGSRTYDIGAVYSFGNVYLEFISLSYTEDRNVMSYYAKNELRMQTDIDKIVSILQELD